MDPPPPPPRHHPTSSSDPPQQTPPRIPTPPPHLTHPSSCCNCGGPTSLPPPPETPSYIPIRYPAVNLPPDTPLRARQSIILTPVPQPSPITPLTPPFHFTLPSKIITSPSDASRFVNSPSSGLPFLGFIAALSSSVRSRKLSDPLPPLSPALSSLLSSLSSLDSAVESFPPATQSSRYGNPSFRLWHDHMSSSAPNLILSLLNSAATCPSFDADVATKADSDVRGADIVADAVTKADSEIRGVDDVTDVVRDADSDDIRGAVVELVPYFTDSFGNASRIDYGTGHETNFAAFLYCLARLGVIREEEYPAVVIRVFVKYLDLMRKLQLVYCLEPAGSHGVWGLDDYHFLPFVFGSAQLIDHKYMKPKSIHNEDILENFSREYMYLSCIQFVKKVKKGPFAEHSPLLDDISGVPNWNKVNSGLLKMYRAEVLEKVPVVQHFLFGSIIPWE